MSHNDTSVEALVRDAMPEAVKNPEEQCRLALAAQQGDEQAMHRLLLGSVGLVMRLATRHLQEADALGLEMADLVSAGLYGLTDGDRRTGMRHAVSKFDPSRGVRLSSYARYWILDAMQQLMRRSALVRGPVGRTRALQRAEVTETTLTTDDDPAEVIDRVRNLGAMLDAMPHLSDRQREVIDMRYGQEMNTAACARALGISRQAVSACESAALRVLRAHMPQ